MENVWIHNVAMGKKQVEVHGKEQSTFRCSLNHQIQTLFIGKYLWVFSGT